MLQATINACSITPLWGASKEHSPTNEGEEREKGEDGTEGCEGHENAGEQHEEVRYSHIAALLKKHKITCEDNPKKMMEKSMVVFFTFLVERNVPHIFIIRFVTLLL